MGRIAISFIEHKWSENSWAAAGPRLCREQGKALRLQRAPQWATRAAGSLVS